jgi:hypothetical protein
MAQKLSAVQVVIMTVQGIIPLKYGTQTQDNALKP